MATYTTNYNLKKPAQEDFIDVADLNANFDALDTQLKAVADTAEEQAGAAAQAAKSVSQDKTLLAASWTGDAAPYTYNATFNVMGLKTNGFLAVSQSATAAQREAARAALLSVTGRSGASGTGNVLTITADGEKPTVDIPVTLIMLA